VLATFYTHHILPDFNIIILWINVKIIKLPFIIIISSSSSSSNHSSSSSSSSSSSIGSSSGGGGSSIVVAAAAAVELTYVFMYSCWFRTWP